MSISRKENGVLVKKAGKQLVDPSLSASSNNAVANSAVTAAINQTNADVTWYGTCGTAAATQQKAVTTTDAKFTLVTGAKVKVKFTYANTHATPTLKVDSTTAKSIKAYGTTAPTVWWKAGDVVEFTYDGTNFIMSASQGEIEQLNSDLSELVATNGNLYGVRVNYAKISDIVILSLNTANDNLTQDTAVGTLPVGYRPSSAVTMYASGSTYGSTGTAIPITIGTDGTITPTVSVTGACLCGVCMFAVS